MDNGKDLVAEIESLMLELGIGRERLAQTVRQPQWLVDAVMQRTVKNKTSVNALLNPLNKMVEEKKQRRMQKELGGASSARKLKSSHRQHIQSQFPQTASPKPSKPSKRGNVKNLTTEKQQTNNHKKTYNRRKIAIEKTYIRTTSGKSCQIQNEHMMLMHRAMIFAKRTEHNVPLLFSACRKRIRKDIPELSEAIGYSVREIEEMESGTKIDYGMLEALLKYIGTLSRYLATISEPSSEVTRIKRKLAQKQKEDEEKTNREDSSIRRYSGMESQVTRKDWGAAARPAKISR